MLSSSLFITKYLNKVVKKATEISDYSNLSQTLTGFNGEKHILVLLMNNSEARFGGGFIGTVGYLTVNKGNIKAEPMRSVYFYDKNFEKVNYREDDKFQPNISGKTLYNLRDGNQNMDWRYNGKRAKAIFELEAGKKVDVVVSTTPEVLKYLLSRLGSIDVPEYNKTITADNLLDSIQTEVEYGEDKKEGKDPKTIISYVAEGVIQKLQDKSLNELIGVFKDSHGLFESKQLLIYTADKRLSGILNKTKMDGAMSRSSGDYFMMAENNYSIDKSNAFIERSLTRNIKITQDGSAQVNMVFTRRQSKPISYEYIDPHAPGIVTNLIRANKSTIHFAVPKGSVINYVEGDTKVSKVNSEGAYDIYGFNSELEPLVQSDYVINYTLPFKYDLNSNILDFSSIVQLQAGGWPYKLHESLDLPNGWKLSGGNNSLIRQESNKTFYDNIIQKDELITFNYAK